MTQLAEISKDAASTSCLHTPSLSKEENPIVDVPTFYSESCEMADRKRPENSKEASGKVVSRLFRCLSPTKSYRGDETPASSSNSTTQA
ncbi:hypothetical protein KQX54_017163 [Cotesia glomerata]|uniref:Uncharacterized protein n=1 Tax=Cotesia glomerata TaxID=32391 RepID=A0AAV7I773_COTGL|nr:hypothetical protein KQX54_017163 [Cotesia glomerata]